MKRLLSLLLIAALCLSLFPTAALAQEPETVSVSNAFIEATVNPDNGGYIIRTKDGDTLIKGDENKDLLYRNEDFDTSFTTIRITDDKGPKDYIFGNQYGFLGLQTSGVKTTADAQKGTIDSVWTIRDLEITQHLELVNNESSNEHGTVRIAYTVKNNGSKQVSVQIRMLMDTCMGDIDYGYYEIADPAIPGKFNTYERETTLRGDQVPVNYTVVDDPNLPTAQIYCVNEIFPDTRKPYRMTFAHWNNLAATMFDYEADPNMFFTNDINKLYETADSAAALYYDLGAIDAGKDNTLSTYYGVNSNVRFGEADSIAVNLTSPTKMVLSEDRKNYLDINGDPTGKFTVTSDFLNVDRIGARDWEHVKIAVITDPGLQVCDDNWKPVEALDSINFSKEISDFTVGSLKKITWNFKAAVQNEHGFHRIHFYVYNMPDSAQGLMLQENIIGQGAASILLPAGDGALPEITFTGSNPKILYNQGKRSFTVLGKNLQLLNTDSGYTLKAYSTFNPALSYTIPFSNIRFDRENPNAITIMMTEAMETGNYQLHFNWQQDSKPDGVPQDLTAPALQFVVSDLPEYKNDSYGILTVEKNMDTSSPEFHHYKIHAFENEKAYQAFMAKGDNQDNFNHGYFPLILRGSMIKEETDKKVSYTTKVSGNETVVINGALDFREGNITLEESDGTVRLLNRGKLLTTGSGTMVAAVPSSIVLEKGYNYCPAFYNVQDGSRIYDPIESATDRQIRLIWDNAAFNLLQSVAGFALKFRYGEFGLMGMPLQDEMDTDPCVTDGEYVVSFGGEMNLAFLMPGGIKQAEEEERRQHDEFWESIETENRINGSPLRIQRGEFKPSDEAKKSDKESVKGEASASIKDVLYGTQNGKSGLIGINAGLHIKVPKIVDALPAYMEGDLSVNTIKGYDVSFAGATELANVEVQFELRVRGAPKTNAPIPDKLYFFLGGAEPGLMVIPPGALWLTGGGGGFDHLYDTIYSKSAVPPLTIRLTVQFDVFKILSSKADLEVSARHLAIGFEDLTLKKIDWLKFSDGGRLSAAWYPDFHLSLNASVNFINAIKGTISIDAYKDFFEMMVRAALIIPDFIPIISGLEIASVELGGGTEKIWGKAQVIGLGFGVTYYWGTDSVEFGSISSVSNSGGNPIGALGVPYEVGTDPESGKTLYMAVGNNASVCAESQVDYNWDPDKAPVLSDEELAQPFAKASPDMTEHLFNIPDGGKDILLTMEYNGAAQEGFQRNDLVLIDPDGNEIPLILHENDNPDPNANCYITPNGHEVMFGLPSAKAGVWRVSSSASAKAAVVEMAPIAQIRNVTASVSGSEITARFDGDALDGAIADLYLTTDENEIGFKLNKTPATAIDGTVSGTIPDDLVSGDYFVRVIMQKDGDAYQSELAQSQGSNFVLHHRDPKAPAEPQKVQLTNCGNDMLKVTITDGAQAAQSEHGYLLDVLEQQEDGVWTETGVKNLLFDMDEEILVGGQYICSVPDPNDPDKQIQKQTGFTPGRKYKAIVRAVSQEEDSDREHISVAVESAPTVLKASTPITASMADATGTAKMIDGVLTYTSSQVGLKLTTPASVDAAVGLNSSVLDEVTAATEYTLTQELPDGLYTVQYAGKETEDGDGFLFTQQFAVDTQAPNLLMEAPVSGGLLTPSLRLKARTDPGSLFTIKLDGKVLADHINLDAYMEDGLLDYPLEELLRNTVMDQAVYFLEIEAADPAGNTAKAVCDLSNPMTGELDHVEICHADGTAIQGGEVILDQGGSLDLRLMGVTGSGSRFWINDPTMIQWASGDPVLGASVGPDGHVTRTGNSLTYISGTLLAAEDAGYSDCIVVSRTPEKPQPVTSIVAVDKTANGTVSVSKKLAVEGESVTVTVRPDSGYYLDKLTVTDIYGRTVETIQKSEQEYVFTMPGCNVTVRGAFRLIPPIEYPIHVKQSANGKVTVSASQAPAGTAITVTAKPDKGYKLGQLTVKNSAGDIIPVTAKNNTCTFTMPDSTVTVYAVFAEIDPNPFTDVFKTDSFYDAVIWAVQAGIATGTTPTTFSPRLACNRAQIVTFLWRAAGKPAARSRTTAFKDVDADAYYYEAVLWATENNIVKGTSTTAFSPYERCSRAQAATFLHRIAGCPAPGIPSPTFTDVSPNSYYYRAVQWAVEAGLTNGTGNNLFSPIDPCTRGQIVTFLYRYYVTHKP